MAWRKIVARQLTIVHRLAIYIVYGFTIAAQAAEGELPMTNQRPRSAARVLLVDDDVDFVEVNRLALEQAGFHVMTAYDGDEGFRQAAEHRPDVVVLDVMMRTPEEGFELARRLRGDQRTEKLPLLMLTGVNEVNRARGLFTFSDRDRDATWLPVDRFLEKPIAPERLVPAVREVLAER
jgi:CheY-like chemotaxis protein